MKDLLRLRATNRVQREKYKFPLEFPKSNQVTFGCRSLRIQDPKVWNLLPYHFKRKFSKFRNSRNFQKIGKILGWKDLQLQCLLIQAHVCFKETSSRLQNRWALGSSKTYCPG